MKTLLEAMNKLKEAKTVYLYGLKQNGEFIDLHWMKGMGFYPDKETAESKFKKYLDKSGYSIGKMSEEEFIKQSLDKNKYLKWKDPNFKPSNKFVIKFKNKYLVKFDEDDEPVYTNDISKAAKFSEKKANNILDDNLEDGSEDADNWEIEEI